MAKDGTESKLVEPAVEETKGFYDWDDEELDTTIGTDRYQLLRVTDTVHEFWPDGRDRGKALTEVVEGPDAGRKGPNLTFSHQGNSGTTKAGKPFTIPDVDAQKRFIREIRAVHDNNVIQFTNGKLFDSTMMAEALEAIEGDVVIAWVTKRGRFTDASLLYAVSNPPEDYTSEADAEDYD